MTFLPLIVSLFALVFTFFLLRKIRKTPLGNGKKIAVFHEIFGKQQISFKKQLKIAGPFVVFLFLLLLPTLGFKIAIGFLFGFILAEITSLAYSYLSIQSSLRVIESHFLAFKGGLASGLLVMSLGVFGGSLLYNLTQSWQSLAALSLGVVLAAFFLKSENVDPAMDVLSSFFAALAAATALISLNFPGQTAFSFLPIFLGSAVIPALILLGFFPQMDKKLFAVAVLLTVLGFAAIVKNFTAALNLNFLPFYASIFLGFLVFGALFFSDRNRFFKKYWLIILVCLGILASFWSAGSTGFALFLVSLISLAGIGLISKVEGLITETAGRIAEEAQENFSPTLPASDLKTPAGFFTLSAVLAALGLFLVYGQEVWGSAGFSLQDSRVLIGLILGGLSPEFFAYHDRKTWQIMLVLLVLPVLIGFLLGPEALAGFLASCIVIGIAMRDSAGPVANLAMKFLNAAALLIVGFLV